MGDYHFAGGISQQAGWKALPRNAANSPPLSAGQDALLVGGRCIVGREERSG